MAEIRPPVVTMEPNRRSGYRVLAITEHRGVRQVGAMHTLQPEEYEWIPVFWRLFDEDGSVPSFATAQAVRSCYRQVYRGEDFQVVWVVQVIGLDVAGAFEAAAQEAAGAGLSFDFQGFDVTLDDAYESLLPRMPRALNTVGLLDTVGDPVLAEAADAWKSVEDEWDNPLDGEPLVWAVWHVASETAGSPPIGED